jgi:NADH:ubiquinone oxidoreductase subunit D
MYRPFSFDTTAISTALFRDITAFITRCSRTLAGSFMGLLYNRALKTRLSMVGQISVSRIKSYGVTGLIARSGG